MTNEIPPLPAGQPMTLAPPSEPQWIPTAWQSVPGFVRFAVWLWAIGVVLSVVCGIIVGIALAAELG